MNVTEFLTWLKIRPEAAEAAFMDKADKQARSIALAQKLAIRRFRSARRAERTGLAERGENKMEASIRVERSKRGYVIRGGGPATTGPDGYDHALALEFGTRHQAASPFFYTTARAKKPAARAELEDAILKAVASDD